VKARRTSTGLIYLVIRRKNRTVPLLLIAMPTERNGLKLSRDVVPGNFRTLLLLLPLLRKLQSLPPSPRPNPRQPNLAANPLNLPVPTPTPALAQEVALVPAVDLEAVLDREVDLAVVLEADLAVVLEAIPGLSQERELLGQLEAVQDLLAQEVVLEADREVDLAVDLVQVPAQDREVVLAAVLVLVLAPEAVLVPALEVVLAAVLDQEVAQVLVAPAPEVVLAALALVLVALVPVREVDLALALVPAPDRAVIPTLEVVPTQVKLFF